MTNTIQLFDERMGRLHEAGLTGLWLVNAKLANLDDLLNAWRPGAIVRVRDVHNSVRFIPQEGSDVAGCIAGWISEDDSSKTDASGACDG